MTKIQKTAATTPMIITIDDVNDDVSSEVDGLDEYDVGGGVGSGVDVGEDVVKHAPDVIEIGLVIQPPLSGKYAYQL